MIFSAAKSKLDDKVESNELLPRTYLVSVRKVLPEAARIARGKVQPLSDLNVRDLRAIVFPGGFGVAKNL